jgi:osmoprotectant transport system ATP-binding protein
LNLQAQIRKTIVLVTHDVTEAVRLGDRIAILSEHARLAQYDTPAAILAKPADAFVAAFIGSGAAIRRLGLETVGSIDLDPIEAAAGNDVAVVRTDQSLYDALDAMLRVQRDSIAVVDDRGRRVGALTWSAIMREPPPPPAQAPPTSAPADHAGGRR